MDAVNKKIITVNCLCGVSESITFKESGSPNGVSWEEERPMANFTVDWDIIDKRSGPMMTSIKCKSCGAEDCNITYEFLPI